MSGADSYSTSFFRRACPLVYAFFSEVSRSLLPARGELSAVTPSGSVRFDVLLDPIPHRHEH